MKCIVIGIISSLLVGLSSAHVIQPTIIQKSELDQADQNQDTLVFAHIVRLLKEKNRNLKELNVYREHLLIKCFVNLQIFRHGERDIPKSIDLTDVINNIINCSL